MNYILSLVLICFGLISASSQKYTVEGFVLDYHDKTPLENTTVVIGSQSAKTDNKGFFIIQNIAPGHYTILANHPSCDAYSDKLDVNKNLHLTINLEHHVNEIEKVSLHAFSKSKSSMQVKTIDKQLIEQNSTENLGNLLTKVSGVTALKTGNNISKPVIHGLYGSRISVINNGTKMAEQEWGIEHAPNVDVNAFEHIDVIKGASALKYGNESIGGVVVLEPQLAPKKDTLMGNLKFSGISNRRGTEFSANILKSWENQWYVKTGGSYKKLGDQYIPHHTLQNTGAEINAMNFSFGKQVFDYGFDVSYSGIQQNFGIYKGAHLSSPEDFYQAINFGQSYFLDQFGYAIVNPRQEVNHHIIKASLYKRFAHVGKFSLDYSFQINGRKEYDIRRGENSTLPSMDLRLITNSLRLSHLIERKLWSLESGVSGSVQDNYPNPATKARRLIPDYYRYDAGAFAIFKYKITNQLRTELGARYDFNRYDAYKYYDASTWERDYAQLFPQFFVSKSDSRILTHPILDYHNFSANLGLVYSPSKLVEIKFNLSSTERAPNPAELFSDGLHHSAAIMEEGNLAIKKERVYNANLNIVSKLNLLEGFRLELSPYFMHSDSFINQVPTGVTTTNRGVFPVWSYQQIKAEIYGLDADAELNLTNKLSWKASFSYLHGQDLTHNEALILMMPTNLRTSIEWKLDQLNNLYVRLENENGFKQNRYPIRNVNVDFIEDGVLVSREIDYSSTPAAYSIFHISAGVDLIKNFNLNLRVNNIFNKEYREYLNRLRYFMPEPGRNVVLTLRYQF